VLVVGELVRLTGHVVEEGTGTPIAGAAVVVERVESVASTDAEGRFTIEGIPAGPWCVGAARPGYDFAELRPPQEGEARLELPKGTPVAGTVTDAAGQPVPGALLRVEGLGVPSAFRGSVEAREAAMEGFVTRADDQGRYRLPGVPAGPHLIVAFASEPGRMQLEIEGGRMDTGMMTEGLWTLPGMSTGYGEHEVGKPVRLQAWSRMAAPIAAGCGWAIIEGGEQELTVDITLAVPEEPEE
jgi:hypothetical protein